jgi:glycosyltransferase involved in cell wall biosynthesis
VSGVGRAQTCHRSQLLGLRSCQGGCSEAARFVEHVELEQLPTSFEKHDVVWAPSVYDNLALMCLEAMTCRKAFIVSDAGGLPEMVNDHETGLVFPVADADALTRCTLDLCASPVIRHRLGRNARQYTETHCSVDAIYHATMDLYQLALERSRGGSDCGV